MLAVIIFVVLFNCFPAKENGGNQNTCYKFVGSEYGDIKGHLASDGDYFAFLGIPYAAPPIGINRFKGPKSPAPWEGTYDAIRTVKCPQQGEGDEDCLVLNVFTPFQPAHSLLPVLFYIHGGAFLLGSGPIDGMEPFIKQNIIVVTINYRLGALGFLCLGIKEAPGNAGLKDQVAALKWVHENILYFGGDPKQVTIYGMGAGGASVEYLVLSKAAKGLFAQAIMESASATSVWAIDADPISTSLKVGKILGFPETKHMELLVEFYKTMDIDVLTDINFDYYNNLTDGTSGFVPCIERKLDKVKPFITVSPQKILEGGKYRRVPMMILFTSLEGLFRSAHYYEQNYKERMDLNFLDFMPADLIFMKEKLRVETGMNVKRFYFGNSSIGSPSNIIQYLNYFGDCLILHAMLSSSDAHSRGGNTVYLMEFSYKGGLGIREGFFEFVNAAGHGDVVQYTILKDTPKNEMDKLTVLRVTSLIGNFVKYGDPTPSETSLHPVIWPPVQPGNLTYLYLDKEFQVDYNPYEERIEMWDKLYAKFRRPVKPVRPG